MFGIKSLKRTINKQAKDIHKYKNIIDSKEFEIFKLNTDNDILKIQNKKYKEAIDYFEKLNNLSKEELNELLDKRVTLQKVLEMFNKSKKYEIITLCGSTKFKDEFIKAQEELTLQGKIVISVGLFGHADNKYGNEITEEIKTMLDDIHKRKIDLSDAIYVINKNGYIGSSTKSEIEYALRNNKKIYYLEEIK